MPPPDSLNPCTKSPPDGEKKNSQNICLVLVPWKQPPGASRTASTTKKSGRLPSVAIAVWAEAQPSTTQPGCENPLPIEIINTNRRVKIFLIKNLFDFIKIFFRRNNVRVFQGRP